MNNHSNDNHPEHNAMNHHSHDNHHEHHNHPAPTTVTLAQGREIFRQCVPQLPHTFYYELVAHICNISYSDAKSPTLQGTISLNLATLEAHIQRLKAGTPLHHITGTCNFYGYDFVVSPSVLIPRGETEILVHHALTALQRLHKQHNDPITVLDLCTGSGCIALTILLEAMGSTPSIPVRVMGVDISADALGVAHQNALNLGVRVADASHYSTDSTSAPRGSSNADTSTSVNTNTGTGTNVNTSTNRSSAPPNVPPLTLVLGDALAPHHLGIPRSHIVVCNPPYICAQEYSCLPLSTLHEPKIALTPPSGRGDEFYATIIPLLPMILVDGTGEAFFELPHNTRFTSTLNTPLLFGMDGLASVLSNFSPTLPPSDNFTTPSEYFSSIWQHTALTYRDYADFNGTPRVLHLVLSSQYKQ